MDILQNKNYYKLNRKCIRKSSLKVARSQVMLNACDKEFHICKTK